MPSQWRLATFICALFVTAGGSACSSYALEGKDQFRPDGPPTTPSCCCPPWQSRREASSTSVQLLPAIAICRVPLAFPPHDFPLVFPCRAKGYTPRRNNTHTQKSQSEFAFFLSYYSMCVCRCCCAPVRRRALTSLFLEILSCI